MCVCFTMLPQFPWHWAGFPAILKSWFDRLWISGFTFTWRDNYEIGLLKVCILTNKRIISTTTHLMFSKRIINN